MNGMQCRIMQLRTHWRMYDRTSSKFLIECKCRIPKNGGLDHKVDLMMIETEHIMHIEVQ